MPLEPSEVFTFEILTEGSSVMGRVFDRENLKTNQTAEERQDDLKGFLLENFDAETESVTKILYQGDEIGGTAYDSIRWAFKATLPDGELLFELRIFDSETSELIEEKSPEALLEAIHDQENFSQPAVVTIEQQRAAAPEHTFGILSGVEIETSLPDPTSSGYKSGSLIEEMNRRAAERRGQTVPRREQRAQEQEEPSDGGQERRRGFWSVISDVLGISISTRR